MTNIIRFVVVVWKMNFSEIYILATDVSKLTDATRYYYIETKPTASGNYWHYDEDGNVAVW